MKVRDVLIRPPATIAAGATVKEAAQAMAADGVGSLVVTEDGRPVGLVTDRDLVVRGLAHDVPLDGRVDAVMSTGVTALDADADVRDAVKVFGTHAIRRLPVVEGDVIVGVISVDDLLTSLSEQLADVTRGLTAQAMFPHAGDEPPPPTVTT